jgi:hypothetical protein
VQRAFIVTHADKSLDFALAGFYAGRVRRTIMGNCAPDPEPDSTWMMAPTAIRDLAL